MERSASSASRRLRRAEFLAGGALGLAATALPSCESAHGNEAQPPREAQRVALLFFNQTEANTIAAMAERIFPADATGPGAGDLHVMEYIDRRLAGGYGLGAKLYRQGPFYVPADSGHGWQINAAPAQVYRDAIAAINTYAQRKHNGTFYDLAPDAQDAVLADLEGAKVDTLALMPPADFFTLFSQDVMQGLFADPLYGGNYGVGGWKLIGFPGDPMAYGDNYEKYIDRYDVSYKVDPVPLQ